MHAGVDVGLTLTKAVWKKDDIFQFRSSAEYPLESILLAMQADGIQQLRCAGAGNTQGLYGVHRLPGIENEIALQAQGVRQLAQLEGKTLPDEYLLISVGSGISYTLQTKDATQHVLGNPLGGRFALTLSTYIGAQDHEEFVKQSLEGQSLDLKYKDVFPELAEDVKGEYIIANFGKVEKTSRKEDMYATITSTVATTIIRDIMNIDRFKDVSTNPSDVVFIGLTVATNPLLKGTLELYSYAIGKTPHFLEKGEYALAMGAYGTI